MKKCTTCPADTDGSAQEQYQFLLDRAHSQGADGACLIPADKLVVRDELARLCGPDNPCPSYGLAPGCPPHALKPAGFRQLLGRCDWVLVFKVNAPMEVLLGSGRRNIARQVHQLSAALEDAVRNTFLLNGHGYAAGSCKDLFCQDYTACIVLTHHLPCPHAHWVRPSLSAVGIDFQALAAEAGWPYALHGTPDPASGQLMGLMAGLVLIEKAE
ncbi:MAG: hypothetical protein GX087_12385 [Desulfobulbaceae bacterium]|nr:hypothetical protein [Desulfobulbaceae bacterium]